MPFYSVALCPSSCPLPASDHTIFLNAGGIPVSASLGNAGLSGVVYVMDAKSPIVAPRPLEVVEQTPDEVAFQRIAFLSSTLSRSQIFAEKQNPVEIDYFAVGSQGILSRAAIFGDVTDIPPFEVSHRGFRRIIFKSPTSKGGAILTAS